MADTGKTGSAARAHAATNSIGRFDPHRSDRSDDANAFMVDPGGGPARIDDDLAESFAEDFVRAATTGQDLGDEGSDVMVDEELGGPFVQTSESEEFGEFSSVPPERVPDDWAREPLPQAMSGLVETPRYGEEREDDELELDAGLVGEDDGDAAARAEADDYKGPNPPHRPSRPHAESLGRR